MARVRANLISVYVVRPAGSGVELLLLQRPDDYRFPGDWQAVHGHIEEGEPAWRAAERELAEETGLDAARWWRLSPLESFYNPENDSVYLVPTFLVEVVPVGIVAFFIAIGITGLSFDSEDPILWSIPWDIWAYGSIILWGWWQFSRRRISLGRLVGRIPLGFQWHSIFGLVGLQILFSLTTFYLIFIPLSYVLPEYVQEILQVPFFLSEAETSSPGLYNGWLIFVIVIVAPVVEELLFRGIIFSRIHPAPSECEGRRRCARSRRRAYFSHGVGFSNRCWR